MVKWQWVRLRAKMERRGDEIGPTRREKFTREENGVGVVQVIERQTKEMDNKGEGGGSKMAKTERGRMVRERRKKGSKGGGKDGALSATAIVLVVFCLVVDE